MSDTPDELERRAAWRIGCLFAAWLASQALAVVAFLWVFITIRSGGVELRVAQGTLGAAILLSIGLATLALVDAFRNRYGFLSGYFALATAPWIALVTEGLFFLVLLARHIHRIGDG